MWKETKSSIHHNQNREALADLRRENGDSLETWEWLKELSNDSPGGCQWYRFDGLCDSPNYGTCDGVGCDHVVVEKGRAYIWEDDWMEEDDQEGGDYEREESCF